MLIASQLKASLDGSNDVNEEDDLFSLLNGLVDSWRERRALNPLRHILAAYPLSMGLSDEWHHLDNALKDVRALCKDELEGEEKEKLNRAILHVQSVLDK
jgi:hypothetical protein